MKKIVLAIVIGLFITVGSMSAALAEDAAPVALKIGVVDLYKAVNDSEQGKKARAELESMVKSKQEALEGKGRAIEKLRADIEKQGDALSADAKKNKADEYERLTRDYQRNMADSQNEVRKKESELTGRILRQVGEIVQAMAQEGKYSLILERTSGLLYVDSALDVTDEVVARLDSAKPKSRKKK